MRYQYFISPLTDCRREIISERQFATHAFIPLFLAYTPSARLEITAMVAEHTRHRSRLIYWLRRFISFRVTDYRVCVLSAAPQRIVLGHITHRQCHSASSMLD